MIILRTLLIVLTLCGSSWAAQLNLSKDAQGWTVFIPSSDSRIVYVSATGNDGTATTYTSANHPDWSHPQNPTGTINAFATYAAAYAQTRTGYPDWILLKRGDTFTQVIGGSIRSGRSATEPSLIGAYGASGASPILKTGTSQAVYIGGSRAWAAISGIDFYAHTRNPDSGEYTGTSGDAGLYLIAQTVGEKIQGILVEGCKFRFYTFNIVMNGDSDYIDGVTVYRNVVTNAYVGSGGNSQGIYVYRINDLVIKENIFDHNGYYSTVVENGIGVASMFGHSSYVNECVDVLMDGNIFTRAASSSNKFRSDHDNSERNITVNNNLNVGGETGYAFNGEGGFVTQFTNITITGNVLANLGYLRPTNRTLAWGFELNGVATANLSGNYIIDQTNVDINNNYGIWVDNLLTNATINNNVFYNFRWVRGLVIQDTPPASTVSNVTFSGNKIQIATDSGYTIESAYSTSSKWVFSGNQYYSDKSIGTRYRLSGSDVTLAAWQTATGDDSTFEQVSFPDPSRNIASYMTSISLTGTLDAFFTAIRAQDRYSWDSRLMADPINDYIKAGFGEAEEPTCSDGVMNGTETGIDCGGSCPACISHTIIGVGTTPIGAGTTAITVQ